MADKPGPGGDGPAPPARNPFPIVVPKGDKHAPQEGRVSRWIRELRRPGDSNESDQAVDTAPEEKREEREEETDRPKDPVERATSQFLPGRLEPVDPEVIQQEIRFLRTGPGEHVVTLGWNIGDPPEHVTLNHSSIQPLHARMTYREGGWWMENLARNDPVVINSSVLRLEAPPRKLADGDRIRIGAVVFRFRIP